MRGKWATSYIVSFVVVLARDLMKSETVDNAIVDFARPLYSGFRVRPSDWKMMACEMFGAMACQRLSTDFYLP